MELSNNCSDVSLQRRLGRLTVARFIVGDVQTARPETTASQIAEIMLEGFGAVPIVDATQRLIGIVTEHDLLTSLERNEKWGEVLAQDIMTPNPYSVRPDTDLATLVHVLRVSNLIRVPVIVRRRNWSGLWHGEIFCARI